jgi:hypothetical protein
MYKRHTGQVSMLESPEMFGSLPLDPKNDWIKLSKLVPWYQFDRKYRENFRSKKGQPAIDSRIALGALLIKPAYKGISDEDLTKEIAMNPYLQYFLGLREYRYECPFDPSMMTRFRQRITPEMLSWVNDQVIGRKAAEEKQEPPKDDDPGEQPPADSGDGGTPPHEQLSIDDVCEKEPEETPNEGTLILDATCAPQNIRFPTDTSLLNEAREKTEEIIDLLHEQGLSDGKKPRTYRREARRKYNSFSKARKKTRQMIRSARRQQLQYLKRNLGIIDEYGQRHPGCLQSLPKRKQTMLEVVRMLYTQQEEMYRSGCHQVADRIVSLSQPWVRPIVRGKQNAEVEFGAKVEMSVVDGYLRIEDLRWNAFNESTTLIDSVEAYRKSYGHYPARVLADTIFRTRKNLRFCKDHGIHLNGPKLGKPYSDPEAAKEQKKLEWLESGERGDIERKFGAAKRRYTLDCIVTKLQETSETLIHSIVLFMNLRKKLRLLLRSFFRWLQFALWSRIESANPALG